MTKQLRQNLRAACMERNDVEAFDLICKILVMDPGDNDLLAQRKEVGRRLFDKESKELGGLIDSGDNERLEEAIRRLDSYVDHNYATGSTAYVEAKAIVTEYRKAKSEAELDKKYFAFTVIHDLKEQEEAAIKLESYATNSGVSLSDKQLKRINQVHKEWADYLIHEEQLKKLKEISKKADALDESLDQLRQNYKKELYEGIIAELTACSSAISDLTLPADTLGEPVERFSAIQNTAKALSKEHYSKLRRRVIIKTTASAVVLVFATLLTYLLCTVNSKIQELQDRLAKADIPYIQEVEESFSSKLYSIISQDFATEHERCRQFLQERIKQQHRYKETIGRLDNLKRDINSATVATYVAELTKLREIHDQYKVRFKEEIDIRWVTQNREYGQAVEEYYETRQHHFANVRPDMAIDRILNLYHEFYTEFGGASEQIFTATANRFKNAITAKYSDYENMDERQLDQTLSELKQAKNAGIQLDPDLIGKIQKRKDNISAIRAINRDIASCETLEDYVRVIRRNSVGYEAIAHKFPASALTDMVDHPNNLKLAAQRQQLSLVTGEADGAYGNRDISDLSQLSQLRDVFEGRTNAYMGAKSSEMQAIIKEVTKASSKAWSPEYYSAEKRDKIYVGKLSNLNGIKRLRSANNPEDYADIVAGEKKAHLDTLRKSVGINTRALDDGTVSPIAILQNIAKTRTPGTPALARLYLYKKIKNLVNSYKNRAASGLALSPSLRRDFAELDRRNIPADTAGCWLSPYPTDLEYKCGTFLQEAAAHDYLSEIKQNLKKIETSRFNFIGYIQSDGSPHYIKKAPSDSIYVYSTGKGSPVKFGQGQKYEPYTPIFRLDCKK